MITKDPACGKAADCASKAIELNSLKAQLATAKATAEIANDRQAELQQLLEAASGATIVGRERETVKQLQKNDLAQRRNLDECYDEIAALREEIRRLERICADHKVDTAKLVPEPVTTAPKPNVWGAMTGGGGAQV